MDVINTFAPVFNKSSNMEPFKPTHLVGDWGGVGDALIPIYHLLFISADSVTQPCLTLRSRGLCPPPRGAGCHFLFKGNLPDPGLELRSPTLAGEFLTIEPYGKPIYHLYISPNTHSLPSLSKNKQKALIEAGITGSQ